MQVKDTDACNAGGIGDCYYAPANAYCSGSCFEGFPADCNGDCGGSAIEDCTGVCGGTTLDTDFVCSSENIENGPSPAGATSGVLYDDGGPTSDYSNYSNDVYLIDVGTGVVSVDVVSFDLEKFSGSKSLIFFQSLSLPKNSLILFIPSSVVKTGSLGIFIF